MEDGATSVKLNYIKLPNGLMIYWVKAVLKLTAKNTNNGIRIPLPTPFLADPEPIPTVTMDSVIGGWASYSCGATLQAEGGKCNRLTLYIYQDTSTTLAYPKTFFVHSQCIGRWK